MAKIPYPQQYDDDFINIFKQVITMMNNMGYTYEESLQKAQDILEEAQQTNDMNENVQQQINTLIAESGTSDAEVLQARVDAEGNEYDVLKERLDSENEKIKGRIADLVLYKDTMGDIINENLSVGTIINLNGYHEAGDGGGHKRVVETEDDGTGVQLSNGNWANIVYSTKLYARWFGAKMDGVSDDTAAIQKLFDNFSKANIIVDDGIYNISETVTLKGIWRASTGNNAFRTASFDRATARWSGTEGGCAINVINHHTSIIEGIALERNANAYINFATIWYSKITDFDIPLMTWNKNISEYQSELASTSSYVNVFDNGYTNKPFEVYGLGAGGRINAVSFNDVNFDAKSEYEYNIKFYGTGGYHLIRFNGCDLSYATKSNFYIDQDQSTMFLGIYNCYLDSDIPLVENHNYKRAKVLMEGQRESSKGTNQKYIMTTKNFLNNIRLGTEGVEADNLPSINTNLIINGDFANRGIGNSWFYSYPGTGKEIVESENTMYGNAGRLTFSEGGHGARFRSVSVPFTGKYSVLMRLKKVSGNGILEISHGGAYPKYDISSFNDGEEVVLTYQRPNELPQGAEVSVDLIASEIHTNELVIDVLEVVLMPGVIPSMYVPTHPKATTAPMVKLRDTSTSGRPTNVPRGYVIIDNTLNKIIWYDGETWRDYAGNMV